MSCALIAAIELSEILQHRNCSQLKHPPAHLGTFPDNTALGPVVICLLSRNQTDTVPRDLPDLQGAVSPYLHLQQRIFSFNATIILPRKVK